MKKMGKDTLLIIDDMPHHLKLLQHYLQQYDFYAHIADSGEMGLELLRNSKFKPDLILLDAIMPEIDGYEVCKRLKADPQLCDIPVIFMTSLWEMNDKVSAFAAGASDFLTKPFSPEELVARMSVHLELNRTKQRLKNEIVEREHNYQRLQALGQEIETVARFVGQRLKKQLDVVEPLLENISSDQFAEGCEIKLLFQNVKEKLDDVFFIINSNVWQLEKQPLNMGEILQPICHKLVLKYPTLKITFPDAWLSAQGYRIWIEKIWDHLLSFCVQQCGKNLQLTISNELVESSVRFSIKNYGVSLTKTQIAKLLSHYEHEQVGMTNELFLVRYLVERCEGEFFIENKGLVGNIFSFTLPVALSFGDNYNRYLTLTV